MFVLVNICGRFHHMTFTILDLNVLNVGIALETIKVIGIHSRRELALLGVDKLRHCGLFDPDKNRTASTNYDWRIRLCFMISRWSAVVRFFHVHFLPQTFGCLLIWRNGAGL
jgi:hypothetical protein